MQICWIIARQLCIIVQVTKMKKYLILIGLLLFAGVITGCQATTTTTLSTTFSNPNPDYCVLGQNEGVFVCQKTWSSYFDAPISLKIYISQTSTFDLEEVFDTTEMYLEEYHKLMDKYNHYDDVVNVYSINNSDTYPITVGLDLFNVIKYGLDHEDVVVSGGVSLFNIALGPILSIWHDARENSACQDSLAYSYCPVPASEIEANTTSTNPDDIIIDEENLTISFLEPNMEIDLGGYGKGYVSEIITDYLDGLDIDYILNAGNSNLKAGGENPDRENQLFYIGLIRPTIEFTLSKEFYAYIKIPSGISVVTSGNYQRFFKGIEDEVVYHHIIDPRTNYPGGEAMSVTVFYEDGALSDIYSTAIYLMTIEEGLAFVNQTPNLEAVWYKTDGTLVYSENFEDLYFYMFP